MRKKIWFFGGLILFGIVIPLIFYHLPPNWFKPDYLVNVSSILTLISFTVSSILSLRLLAIGAQLTFIPYCLLQSPPLWTPVIWNLLFMGVNIINVIILLLERRPVKFNPDEKKLYNLVFKSLSPREFLKLLALGEWREGQAGEILIYAGQINTFVAILCHGQAVAILDEDEVANIPDGKLLGVPSIFAGEPLPLAVKLKTPSRYICWPIQPLRKFLDSKPELRAKLRSIVSQDLAKTVQDLQEYQLKQWRKTKEAQSVLDSIDSSNEKID